MNSIPFHRNALEQSSELLFWIKTWAGNDLEVLTPENWYVRGHDLLGSSHDARSCWRYTEKPGKLLWVSPLAAADTALEELRKARIKQYVFTHIFVFPGLLTSEWLKQLHKVADCVFELPPVF